MKNKILLILSIIALSGCNVIKQARDQKALDRVMGKYELREEVYQVQSGLHPLLPQEPVYIKGKDSIIEIHYPVYIKGQDSIIRAQCPALNLDSLKKALATIVTKVRIDTTIKQDTTLRRLLDNALSSSYKKDGQIIEKDKQISEYKKQINKRNWIDIGAGVVTILIIGFLVYLLLKKR